MNENEKRKKLVETATKYLFYNETDGSHKQIIDIYNGHRPLARGYTVQYDDPWCATFVSAIAILLDYTDIIPIECSCSKMIGLCQERNIWIEDDTYTPKPGDIIFYDWNDNGKADCTGHPEHVGFVVKIAGSSITVIEGNYNHSVRYRKITVNGKYIRGYCVPRYGTSLSDSQKIHYTSKTSYTVQAGDTLSEIALNFNTTVDKLVRLNNINNPDLIYIGQQIKIS